MTEKRFKEIISIETIIDNKTGLYYKPVVLTDDFLEVVNELHEENEQLKQYKKAIWDLDSSKIIRVNKNTGEVDLVDKELEE